MVESKNNNSVTFNDNLDHRTVNKKSLDETLSDPNTILVDEHENKYGNETIVVENQETGDRQTFPNVREDSLKGSDLYNK